MGNKKGAEFTISTLVVIVLAIIVLVVVVLGFGTGWSNLWNQISSYSSPSNVDTIKQACSLACSSQSAFDYCCVVRNVRFDRGGDVTPSTCRDAVIKPVACDLTCDVAVTCASVMCANGQTKEKDETCLTNEKEDTSKKLDSTGKPLGKDVTCCVPKA